MKNKLIPLISIFLSLVGQCLYADIEKTMTIYMNNGTEKELRIPVPSSMASRADEYAKAYTILYMKWWNAGVQFNLPYMFDSSHFENNTPPKRITAIAGNHAEYVFGMTDLIDKVEQEGANYLEDQTYQDNPPAKEVEIVLGKNKSKSSGLNSTMKVKVPERFQKRAEEYGEAYAQEYESAWDSMFFEAEEYEVATGDMAFHPGSRRWSDIKIGPDIRAYIKKIFQEEPLLAEIRSAMEAKLKIAKAAEAERRKKRAANKKREESLFDN